jgi:hypothetical protein
VWSLTTGPWPTRIRIVIGIYPLVNLSIVISLSRLLRKKPAYPQSGLGRSAEAESEGVLRRSILLACEGHHLQAGVLVQI